jgi:hypothetical protein
MRFHERNCLSAVIAENIKGDTLYLQNVYVQKHPLGLVPSGRFRYGLTFV